MSLLESFGQSLWLDSFRRQMLGGGELQRLVGEHGVRGVLHSPRVLEEVLAGSADYDLDLHHMARQGIRAAPLLYESLAVEDVRLAADALRPLYEATRRRDGYACLELPPTLAHDSRGLVSEARRVWYRLAHQNAMLAVPATREGIAAMRRLVADGISVNVNLIFAPSTFRLVVQAYLDGLEDLLSAGGDLAGVAGLATMSLGPLDALADALLEEQAAALPKVEAAELRACFGRIGLASAARIHEHYREILAGPRFGALDPWGAQPQRLAFADTDRRDPRLDELLYVEELFGPDTVAVVSPATLAALHDRGQPRAVLGGGSAAAVSPATLAALYDQGQPRAVLGGGSAAVVLAGAQRLGLAPDVLADRLLEQGLTRRKREYERLLTTVILRAESTLLPLHDHIELRLPEPLAAAVGAGFAEWREAGHAHRLWARDQTLWTGNGENRRLGWLCEARRELESLDLLHAFARQVREHEFAQVAVLGAGHALAAARVLALSLPPALGGPRLLVMDALDRAAVLDFEAALDLERTLFVVTGRPGPPTQALEAYFFDRTAALLGPGEAARHFVAVVAPDPGAAEPARHTFHARVFAAVPDIPEAFAALSPLAMVPAAAAQLDIERLLEAAQRMVQACAPCVPPEQNPGVALGVALGCAASHGIRKLGVIASPPLAPLGHWLAGLIGAALDRDGQGLSPALDEPVLPSAPLDRLFAYLRLDGASQPDQDAAVDELVQAGHPIVQTDVAAVYDVGQEFFRWQLAIAVAAAILHLNPFEDRPTATASMHDLLPALRG